VKSADEKVCLVERCVLAGNLSSWMAVTAAALLPPASSAAPRRRVSVLAAVSSFRSLGPASSKARYSCSIRSKSCTLAILFGIYLEVLEVDILWPRWVARYI